MIGISVVKEAEDANTAYEVFIEKYDGICDTSFPFKNVKSKELTNKIIKPWISRAQFIKYVPFSFHVCSADRRIV